MSMTPTKADQKLDDRIDTLETKLRELKQRKRKPPAPRPLGRPLKDSSLPVLDKAVRQFGSQFALASEMGISHQRFSNWRRRGQVPAEWVIALEKASGVSRHVIRPDIYPRE